MKNHRYRLQVAGNRTFFGSRRLGTGWVTLREDTAREGPGFCERGGRSLWSRAVDVRVLEKKGPRPSVMRREGIEKWRTK